MLRSEGLVMGCTGGCLLYLRVRRGGLISPNCCSVISILCWWNICMYRVTQQFVWVLLRHVFNIICSFLGNSLASEF